MIVTHTFFHFHFGNKLKNCSFLLINFVKNLPITWKKQISSSTWSVQHPNAGPSMQQTLFLFLGVFCIESAVVYFNQRTGAPVCSLIFHFLWSIIFKFFISTSHPITLSINFFLFAFYRTMLNGGTAFTLAWCILLLNLVLIFFCCARRWVGFILYYMIPFFW